MNNKTYSKLMKEVKSWNGCKNVLLQKDVDDMIDRNYNAYKNGELTEKQAIKIEKEINSLLK